MNATARRRSERRDDIIRTFWRVERSRPRRSINVRAVAAEAEMVRSYAALALGITFSDSGAAGP